MMSCVLKVVSVVISLVHKFVAVIWYAGGWLTFMKIMKVRRTKSLVIEVCGFCSNNCSDDPKEDSVSEGMNSHHPHCAYKNKRDVVCEPASNFFVLSICI